jgi:crossover junction endodeoxyribonuclease RuvC
VVDREGGRLVHVAHGTLRPPRSCPLAPRLRPLYRDVREVIERHGPDVAAVEEVFVAASPRAALVLGQARGAVLAALAEDGIAVTEYAPAQAKQAVTGSGRATKHQVQRMIQRLLHLERPPESDASDALAAAICHAHAFRLRDAGAPRRRRRRPARAPSVRVGRTR